jgi:hypothetical protein
MRPRYSPTEKGLRSFKKRGGPLEKRYECQVAGLHRKDEANPGEMKSAAKMQEVCNDEGAVEMIEASVDSPTNPVFLHCVWASHKRPTVEKRRRNGPECNNGIKYRDPRRQLRLRKTRQVGRILRKITQLKMEE